MTVKINPQKMAGTVRAVESKSDAHRVLFCAALSNTESTFQIKNISKDILATIGALKALGADIEHTPEGSVSVKPLWGNVKENTYIDCDESGSTLRFILPLAGATAGNFKITAGGRLPYRPINPFIQSLNINGMGFSREKLPLSVMGKLRSGRFLLPGHVSSQFVSGLLFTLPILEGDSEIFLTSELESAAYVGMTAKRLKDFGIRFEKEDNIYKISGGQKYTVPENLAIEGDWSNAAFWLAAGALDGSVEVEGLQADSCQSDKVILEVLKSMGANISFEGGVLKVFGGKLTATEFDASQAPDLFPVVATLMAVSQGTSLIKNAARLRLKESDRLSAISQGLKNLGADIEEGGDYLKITGKDLLKGGEVDGYNDHRIVMALAVLAAKCENGLVINGAQAVEKSYPNFFEDFKSLGGEAHVI
ncbi:MAG TPA: 3-phosphoshikimate 1-carboxyvinyltransferase [Clostridiales bacterium]|nr:3-phosphoshikimate 1-carboxyvinyltransferase [Clostridiales bacterium]